MAFYYLSFVACFFILWYCLHFFFFFFFFFCFLTASQNVEFHIHWVCIKIGFSEKTLWVLVSCTLIFPLRRARAETLNFECKLTKITLQVGYPSNLLDLTIYHLTIYHLTSYRKSNLIHNTSAQISKSFNLLI